MLEKYLISICLGTLSCYLPGIIFNLVVDKVTQRNIIFKMYLAEFYKIISFILILSMVFKFAPVDPVIFIISVITYLIMNFAKNLLKLII